MASALPVDLDFLAARLHGRRGHVAESERLDALCRLRSMPDLVRALAPGSRFTTFAEFQRGLILQIVDELADFASQLDGAGAALMAWLRIRVQVENLKVLARAFATGKSGELVQSYLVALPADLGVDLEGLTQADSFESFVAALPAGVLRAGLAEAATAYQELPRPIVLEAALDRAYFRELLKRTKALPRDARGDSLIIAKQEVDTYHLMLVARGRWTYGLPAAQLVGLHVAGTRIAADAFRRMLEADSLQAAAQLAVGPVLDRLPQDDDGGLGGAGRRGPLDAAVLETSAWNRYLRLARRAFRNNHMGLGAVVAFTAIRRIEVANLITLSEGIRTDMEPGAIRRRLVPSDEEAGRV
jgi:vacuolar-type H+-ATPase subunit C/Vma6